MDGEEDWMVDDRRGIGRTTQRRGMTGEGDDRKSVI